MKGDKRGGGGRTQSGKVVTLRDQFALARPTTAPGDYSDAAVQRFRADPKGAMREALEGIAKGHMRDRASRKPLKASLEALMAAAVASECSPLVGVMIADWTRDLDDLDAGRTPDRLRKAKASKGAPPTSAARKRATIAAVIAAETLRDRHELDENAARARVAEWLNRAGFTVSATRRGGHGQRVSVTPATIKQWASGKVGLGDDLPDFRRGVRDALGQAKTVGEVRNGFEGLVLDVLKAAEED